MQSKSCLAAHLPLEQSWASSKRRILSVQILFQYVPSKSRALLAVWAWKTCWRMTQMPTTRKRSYWIPWKLCTTPWSPLETPLWLMATCWMLFARSTALGWTWCSWISDKNPPDTQMQLMPSLNILAWALTSTPFLPPFKIVLGGQLSHGKNCLLSSSHLANGDVHSNLLLHLCCLSGRNHCAAPLKDCFVRAWA